MIIMDLGSGKMQVQRLAAAICLALAGMLYAQTTASTASAPVAPNMSSPKATLLSIYASMRNGDVSSIQQCMIFEDADEAEMFNISLTKEWAPVKVMRAMQAKYGDGALALFGGTAIERQIDDAVTHLDKIEITINGDVATLSDKKAAVNPNAETELDGVTLKKIENHWKVMAGTFSDIGSAVKPEQVKMLRATRDATAKACDDIVTRVNAGEFPTLEKAWSAYQAHLAEAIRTATQTRP